MTVVLFSISKPVAGSGDGITEYTYQLLQKLRHQIPVKYIWALDQKRKDMKGLLHVKTTFRVKLPKLIPSNTGLVHITDHEAGFGAKIIKRSSNPKVITTIHDVIRLERGLHRGILESMYNRSVKGDIFDAVDNSDFLLFVSTLTKYELRKKIGKLPKNKVISIGIRDDLIDTPIKPTPKSKFVVGYLGSFIPHKNVHMLLDTAYILRNNKDILFRIYGFGRGMKSLMNYREMHRLNNVEFIGYVPEKGISQMYDSFSAFVFPSMYEGFGMPILEAQSRGVPTIVNRNGKIPNEVKKYCMRAESPEHIAQMIEDIKRSGYNDEQKRKAMEYARSFTWKNTAKETLKVYKEVLTK